MPECADSTLIESAVIVVPPVQAMHDTHKAVGTNVKLHVWPERLNAVQQYARSRDTHKRGNIGDRLVEPTRRCTRLVVYWRWVAAQHDSVRMDVVPLYNKRTEQLSRRAAHNAQRPYGRCHKHGAQHVEGVGDSIRQTTSETPFGATVDPHRRADPTAMGANNTRRKTIHQSCRRNSQSGFLPPKGLYAQYEEWLSQGISMTMTCKRGWAWSPNMRHHKANVCPDA